MEPIAYFWSSYEDGGDEVQDWANSETCTYYVPTAYYAIHAPTKIGPKVKHVPTMKCCHTFTYYVPTTYYAIHVPTKIGPKVKHVPTMKCCHTCAA